jgi:hypothetical protein
MRPISLVPIHTRQVHSSCNDYIYIYILYRSEIPYRIIRNGPDFNRMFVGTYRDRIVIGLLDTTFFFVALYLCGVVVRLLQLASKQTMFVCWSGECACVFHHIHPWFTCNYLLLFSSSLERTLFFFFVKLWSDSMDHFSRGKSTS